MNTPSLQTRVVAVGAAAVAVLAVALDLLLYFTLRTSLSGPGGALTRLIVVELVATPLVIALAVVILRWVSEIALSPLDQIAAAARRTAQGRTGQRLHPDNVQTRLGHMAEAYDDMLDALEAAVDDARAAQARSEEAQARSEEAQARSEAAQKSTALLAAIVESSEDAMLSTTLDGTIVTWNTGAQHMYGYSAAEAIGNNLRLIVPPDQEAQVDESMTLLRRGVPVQRVETVRRRKDGVRIDVAITISPLHDSRGEICGGASVARDITEQRWVASRLDATLDALSTALEEARASESSTRRFLDRAAHQLRTPITSIRACAEALVRGADPEDRDRLLGSVVRETTRASRIMTGLLQMARLNEGHKLARKPCDLMALCRQEAGRIRWLSPQLEVEVVKAGELIGMPEVDAEAVAEILANLLDNARRHAVSRVQLTVDRSDTCVELRVVDDGPGIPDNQVESAFDRFVSLDAKGGSGLGLPIARELARAHGGELRYENKSFVVSLPTIDAGEKSKPESRTTPLRLVREAG